MSVFSDNLGVISTGISGLFIAILSFIGGKNLKKSEEKKSESTANIEIGKAYQQMAEQNNAFMKNLRDKVDFQTKEIEGFKEENRDQRKDLRVLQDDNRNLHLEMSQLNLQNNELKLLVSELKSENRQLLNELKKYRKK